ncbi:hypothetical protein AAZX31_19G090000 [Glycine max]
MRFPLSCLSCGSSSRNLSKFSRSSSPRSCSLLCTATASGHQRRPLMDLVTVLDVGNNMSGTKLHMLKCAMQLVISSLGAANRLAVVAFAVDSKQLLPLRRMTNQREREKKFKREERKRTRERKVQESLP